MKTYCVVLCIAASVLMGVLATPTGAPDIACEDMMPLHNITEQTNPSPYSASVVALGGNRYSFTLTGDAMNTFRGVFIEVRDSSDRIVGMFEPADDLKLINCLGGTNNAATHVSNTDKTSVTVVWDGTGGVNFVYTTCMDALTFWVKEALPLP